MCIRDSYRIFNKSSYLTYLYAFLILFAFGLGVGFVRNNLKKPVQEKEIIDNSLSINENKNVFNEGLNQDDKKKVLDNSKIILSDTTEKVSFSGEEIKTASPSLEKIENLINTWLVNKSKFLAGTSEINLSKIVQDDLIDRLKKERELDVQKGIYKNINTNIEKIELLNQTASRISVAVDLKYTEKILKTDGELINETTFTPFLKVKYILGFSNNSWKLVDYISGV